MAESTGTPGEGVALDTRQDTERPSLYKVLLHNDHYTTMDFVVEILTGIFAKGPEEAVTIMLNVHEQGVGLAGVYTSEIAETKLSKTHDLAREHGFPLKCSMEPE